MAATFRASSPGFVPSEFASKRAPCRDVPKLCRMLRSRSLIVIEQFSKSRTTNHRSSSVLGGSVRHDQHIAEALVISLSMKVCTVFSKGTAQHSLPNRDQPR